MAALLDRQAITDVLHVYCRAVVMKVLELGSGWARRIRPAAAARIWLELALVPSVPADRLMDPAHLAGLSASR